MEVQEVVRSVEAAERIERLFPIGPASRRIGVSPQWLPIRGERGGGRVILDAGGGPGLPRRSVAMCGTLGLADAQPGRSRGAASAREERDARLGYRGGSAVPR